MEAIRTTQGDPSDGRLKFNETELSDSRAIELLSAVPISEYRKTQVLMTRAATFQGGKHFLSHPLALAERTLPETH